MSKHPWHISTHLPHNIASEYLSLSARFIQNEGKISIMQQ